MGKTGKTEVGTEEWGRSLKESHTKMAIFV